MDLANGIYSQNDEQNVINDLLGDQGRFLDVGAFEGKVFSNTLRLFERGWSGVLVEPSPKAYAGLLKTYEGKERSILIEAAISDEEGEVVFYDSGGDAISSTDIPHTKKWEAGANCKFDEIKVKTITWNDLFDRYKSNYDFVNIDTEGTNFHVLETFPFDRCLPKCFCIEYENRKLDMEGMLKPYGYRTIYTSGENIVSYRES